MRCSRIKQYNDGSFIEEECNHKYFLSHGYLLHGCVVGVARSQCWASLLAAAQKAATMKVVPHAVPSAVGGAIVMDTATTELQGAQGVTKAGVLKISTGLKSPVSPASSSAQITK
jgi:hypothetical protein